MNETLPSINASSPSRSDREWTGCARTGEGEVATATESRARACCPAAHSALIRRRSRRLNASGPEAPSSMNLYNMASLGLWTLPFCSLACFSFDVLVALHLFPSSHAPVFLGWHLNGVGPLPPPAATTITARRPVSYTHLRAHETRHDLVCRLLLEKKK